jgi:hypothetical protein
LTSSGKAVFGNDEPIVWRRMDSSAAPIAYAEH